ncbi:Lrp/AsnC family transcriptional regulator [Sphingomonas oligophenolica]|uniref:Lrp/AsnC family transcriptional regulator n=1 Tax=Sphingomonas oligophenolica TaxID=301154 RepID=A0ABU9YAQ9_9SPHN
MDPIDRKILNELQADASLAIQELGDRGGLSTNPCWRRIKRMEEAGVIERRVAIINPQALGLGATVFVSIRTNKHNREWLDTLAAGVEQIPEIIECHRMSGTVDYLLKVVVRDIAHYDDVYQRLIKQVPGLEDVSSTFSMERVKFSTAIDAVRCA